MGASTYRYVPSPAPLKFSLVYSATANASGRMQYHKIRPGQNKLRISRTEFIQAFNELDLIALRPVPVKGSDAIIQLEFYV